MKNPSTPLTMNPPARIHNISLFFQEGTSDKEYHLQVETQNGGYVVNFQFGRRGKHLQTGSKTPQPVPHEEALEIRDAVLREKLNKGYLYFPHSQRPAPASAPAPSTSKRPIRRVVNPSAKVHPDFARSLARAVR